MSLPVPFHCFISAARLMTFALSGLVITTAAVGQESVLYDINFSAPTHTLNARPARGAAPDKVSLIPFGFPTVVSSFGELTDRPLLFTGNGDPYDQIKLDGNYQIETCRLEFDVYTEGLKRSGFQFTILLDTPSVRRFSLSGATDTIEGSATTWEEGRRLRCVIFADFKNNLWEARIDGALVFSVPVNATELRSIRFSLGPRSLTSPANPNVKVAVDAIRVTVTSRITPDAPKNFSVTGGTGASAISLSWSGVPEAGTYRIYRSVDTYPFGSNASLIGETSALQYSDTNVALGQTYHYWIRSVMGLNTSPLDPYGSARIVLAPPSSLTVSGPERNDGIQLSWPAPPKATRYRIYRSQSNSFASATLLASTVGLTYLDSNALPGVRSYYWVDSGAGSLFSLGKVAGSGIRGLTMVTGLEASSYLYSNRIDLQWIPVPGATGYNIYRGVTEDFSGAEFLGFASSPDYSDLTAANDLGYRYWVVPRTTVAEGTVGLPVSGVASLFQPDLWLESKSVSGFGRGVVERREELSFLTEKMRDRSPSVVKLWVGKFGEREGQLRVTGSPGDRQFVVNYYRSGNVTVEAVLGRLEVESGPGSGPVQILIQPSRLIRTLPRTRTYQLVCRGVSTTTSPAEDQVGMMSVSLPRRLPKPEQKPPEPVWTVPPPRNVSRE